MLKRQSEDSLAGLQCRLERGGRQRGEHSQEAAKHPADQDEVLASCSSCTEKPAVGAGD